MDVGGIGAVVVGAVADTGDTAGDCGCFIGVSGQFSDVWQGVREGEDKHCDGVVDGDPDKTGDGVGNLGANWCCSESGDEGNTCAGDKEMDSCRVEGGDVVR